MKKTSLAFALSIGALATQAQTTYPGGISGCIARWNFTPAATPITALPDVSNNSNYGTTNNLTTGTGFRNAVNKAMNFDGSTSYATVPHNNSLTPQQMTIVSLVKYTGFYSGNCQVTQILAKGSGYQTPGMYAIAATDGVYDNGNCSNFDPNHTQYGCAFNNSHANLPSYATDYLQYDKWYLNIASYDGNNLKMYQTEMDTNNYVGNVAPYFTYGNINSTIGANVADISIGKLPNASYPYWFGGSMDEIILFNKVLTQAEIQTVYDYLYGKVLINKPFNDTVLSLGSTFNVAYTVSDVYKPGNIFTAQLSDANGSFANPINIGSISSYVNGIIPCTVPATTLAGTGYRVRVMPTNATLVSNDNGKDIRIKVATDGIEEFTAIKNLSIFPNPSHGDFTIKGNVTSSKEVNIAIVNMVGQTVFTETMTVNKGELNKRISLDNTVANGIYMLRIKAGNESKTIRFTVDR